MFNLKCKIIILTVYGNFVCNKFIYNFMLIFACKYKFIFCNFVASLKWCKCTTACRIGF